MSSPSAPGACSEPSLLPGPTSEAAGNSNGLQLITRQTRWLDDEDSSWALCEPEVTLQWQLSPSPLLAPLGGPSARVGAFWGRFTRFCASALTGPHLSFLASPGLFSPLFTPVRVEAPQGFYSVPGTRWDSSGKPGSWSLFPAQSNGNGDTLPPSGCLEMGTFLQTM